MIKQKLIKEDLRLRSRALECCQILTAMQRIKRVQCCRKMLNSLKSNVDKTLVFTDENISNVNHLVNHHNM